LTYRLQTVAGTDARQRVAGEYFTPSTWAEALLRIDTLLCGKPAERDATTDGEKYDEFVSNRKNMNFRLSVDSGRIFLADEPRFYAPQGSPWNKIIGSVRYRASTTVKFNQRFGTNLSQQ